MQKPVLTVDVIIKVVALQLAIKKPPHVLPLSTDISEQVEVAKKGGAHGIIGVTVVAGVLWIQS